MQLINFLQHGNKEVDMEIKNKSIKTAPSAKFPKRQAPIVEIVTRNSIFTSYSNNSESPYFIISNPIIKITRIKNIIEINWEIFIE